MGTRLLSHQNPGEHSAGLTLTPFPAHLCFCNTEPAPLCVLVAAHAETRHTHVRSSKSLLTPELGPGPAWPHSGPSCLTPLLGGPWKCPSCSRPWVLGSGSIHTAASTWPEGMNLGEPGMNRTVGPLALWGLPWLP